MADTEAENEMAQVGARLYRDFLSACDGQPLSTTGEAAINILAHMVITSARAHGHNTADEVIEFAITDLRNAVAQNWRPPTSN